VATATAMMTTKHPHPRLRRVTVFSAPEKTRFMDAIREVGRSRVGAALQRGDETGLATAIVV
jgi:hypothetical protein